MQKVSRKGGKGEGRRRRRRKRNWVLQCLSKRASNVCATHTERVVTHRLSRGWVAVAVAEELGRGGGREKDRRRPRGRCRGRGILSSEHFNIWARRAFEVAGVGGARGQEERHLPSRRKRREEEGEGEAQRMVWGERRY